MANSHRKRSGKSGLPPGSVVHVGPTRTAKPRAHVFQFTPETCSETQFSELEKLEQLDRSAAGITWIDLDGVHDPAWLERLGALFGIHPLVLEDIANTTTRPKFAEYENFMFVSLKSFSLAPGSKSLVAEQISIVFGDNWILSFQEHPGDTYDGIRKRLREGGLGRLRRMGTDYLAYRIVDSTIDTYFTLLEEIGEAVERTEQSIMQSPSEEALRTLYQWKRSFLQVRRAAWPLREAVSLWERNDSPLVRADARPFIRDTYEHIVEVIDIVETHREMISSALELYLSSLSNRLNSVMMVLTLVTTIFMPLTFVAGIYGMNFKYMPELEWRYGYPIALAGMVLIAVGMAVWFRKRGWMQ